MIGSLQRNAVLYVSQHLNMARQQVAGISRSCCLKEKSTMIRPKTTNDWREARTCEDLFDSPLSVHYVATLLHIAA
jgi:hypothetical protein